MAVDYEALYAEGRRLLRDVESGQTLADWGAEIAAEDALKKWLRTHAEALLNTDPWRPIGEADGQIKKDEIIVDLWAGGDRYPECWWSGKRWVSYIAGNSGDLSAKSEAQLYEIFAPTHFREIKGPGQ